MECLDKSYEDVKKGYENHDEDQLMAATPSQLIKVRNLMLYIY